VGAFSSIFFFYSLSTSKCFCLVFSFSIRFLYIQECIRCLPNNNNNNNKILFYLQLNFLNIFELF
jgi:hypothetical protein